MKCWQSTYLINLPSPRNEGCLTLCYMPCPERHRIDNQTRVFDCSGAWGWHGCCWLLHPLVCRQPCSCTCSADRPAPAPALHPYPRNGPWTFIKAKSFPCILAYMTSRLHWSWITSWAPAAPSDNRRESARAKFWQASQTKSGFSKNCCSKRD